MAETKNTLVTYFNKEEIDELYQLLLEHIIRNYEKHEEDYERWNHFQREADVKEYSEINWNILEIKNAIELKTKQINLSDEELEQTLNNAKDKYEQNINDNKEIIDIHFRIILIILLRNMPKRMTKEEKAEYLFEFVTQYINFSEDYYNYCVKTPITEFEFDFKDCVPLEKTVKGTLVQGQGTCEDICNVMQYLGQAFDVPIRKRYITYKNQLHAINTFESDGKISLIDATRVIHGDRKKSECFLVSEEILNRDGTYIIENHLASATNKKTDSQTVYDMDEIIKKVKASLPEIVQKSEINQKKKYQ